jgi:hypothetical protein
MQNRSEVSTIFGNQMIGNSSKNELAQGTTKQNPAATTNLAQNDRVYFGPGQQKWLSQSKMRMKLVSK